MIDQPFEVDSVLAFTQSTESPLDLGVVFPSENAASCKLSETTPDYENGEAEAGGSSAGIITEKLEAEKDVSAINITDPISIRYNLMEWPRIPPARPPRPLRPPPPYPHVAHGILEDISDGFIKNHTPPSVRKTPAPSGAEPRTSSVADFPLPPDERNTSGTDYTTDYSELMQRFDIDPLIAPIVIQEAGAQVPVPKFLVRFWPEDVQGDSTCTSPPTTTHACICRGNYAQKIDSETEEAKKMVENRKTTFHVVKHQCDLSLKDYFNHHLVTRFTIIQALTLWGSYAYKELLQILKFLQSSLVHLHFIDVETTPSWLDEFKPVPRLNLASLKISFNDSKDRLVRNKWIEPLLTIVRFWSSETRNAVQLSKTITDIRGKEEVVFELLVNGIPLVKYHRNRLTLSNHRHVIETDKFLSNVMNSLSHLSCYYLQQYPLSFTFNGISFSQVVYMNLNSCKIDSKGRDYETIFFHSFKNLETLILDGCGLGLNLNKFRQGNSSKLKDVVIFNDTLTLPNEEEPCLQLCTAPSQSITLCNCTLKEYPSYLSEVHPNTESLLIELTPGKMDVRKFLWNYFPWKRPTNPGVREDEWARDVARDKQYYFDLVKAKDFSTSLQEATIEVSQIVNTTVTQQGDETGNGVDGVFEVNNPEPAVETCDDSSLETHVSTQSSVSGEDFTAARDNIVTVASHSHNRVSQVNIEKANVYYVYHAPSRNSVEVAQAIRNALGDSPVGTTVKE